MELRSQEITQEVNSETVFIEEAESTSASFESKEQQIAENPRKARFFTGSFSVLVFFFFISLTIYIISRFVPAFAEFWTRYPAQFIRFALAKVSDILPFSFAESVIITLPISILAFIVAVTVSTRRNGSTENFYRWLRPIVSVVLVIFILFFSAFGPAYGRLPLEKNLGLTREDVSIDELFSTGIILSALASGELSNIAFDTKGASVMPYSFNVLTDKINEAYRRYADGLDYIHHFSSDPKPIALSKPMTYTHISGVYTYMTGEANVNTNYPDFLMPFTVAHEMAHQRGIAREEEANFVAFLVCTYSDDPYIRYSGYVNLLNYVNSSLGKTDSEKGKELFQKYTALQIQKEFVAYSEFFDEYRESTASKVTGTVNNAYLQSQGQSQGTKSYGLVVDLAVAYYKNKIGQ